MTIQQIADTVQTAWAGVSNPTPTTAQLAAVVGEHRELMSWLLQAYRKLQKTDDFKSTFAGYPVIACEGYGLGARWYRVDVDAKTAAEHMGYILRDALARWYSDVEGEVRHSAASDRKYQEQENLYQIIKAGAEAYLFNVTGQRVSLPATLPTR